MKLSVLDRITTSALLPAKASYLNHMLIEEARGKLSFTEDEHKVLNFRAVGNQTVWNQSQLVNKSTGESISTDLPKDMVERMIMADPENFEMKPTIPEIEIPLGEVVTKIIVEALKALDKAENLDGAQLNLYKKFVKPEQE